MAKVIADLNWAILIGSKEEHEKLKEALTFKDPSAVYTKRYKRGVWDGSVRLCRETMYGVLFRSGLIKYVLKFFPDLEIEKKVKPLVQRVVSLPIELRDYQKEAIEEVLKRRVGLVSVPTGGGKTFIGLGIISRVEAKKYLYIVHRQELLLQVYHWLVECFGKEQVGRIGAGYCEDDKKIIVGMVQSLVTKVGREDWKQFFNDIGVLIIDEAHHSVSSSYRILIDSMDNLCLKVGLTGTPPSYDTLEGLKMLGVLGEVIYEVDINLLVQRGYVVGPRVVMYKGTWDVGLRKYWKAINWRQFGSERKFWNIVRDRGIVNNGVRNQLIANLVKGKTGVLVVVDMVEHGRQLQELIGCPFVWAGVKNRFELFESFRKGNIPILICSPVLEEGVDVHGIKTVVIASGGKSKRKLLQRIGRGMRTMKGKIDVEVIDFYDDEIPLLERHSKKRLKVYEQMGFPVQIVNLDKVDSNSVNNTTGG